uniref:Crustacean cardioactive peptide n=1 Tax=Carcinus maenas TaxID=6759 RepID=Q1WK21_CARMA|nr:crustacean cardioactive peptide [Carcinus maenas]
MKMSSTSWLGRTWLVTAGSLLLLVFLVTNAQAGPVAKRDIDSLLDGKIKRPFCNAFTGCGKKRSDPELEGLASGSELNDITKHVLAEARLWEQLQSKMEAMRMLASRMDSRPVFRRKRSLIHPQHDRVHSVTTLNHKGDAEKQ